MGSVYFYHLTRSGAEATLATLSQRALGQGWHVAIRACDAARLSHLDQALWLAGGDDSFLPHGLAAGGPQDALQPILLTLDPAPDRACLMLVDGAKVTADEVRTAERVCVLFDGGSDAAVSSARQQWKSLTAAGLAARYWSEEGGSWTMKAESGGG